MKSPIVLGIDASLRHPGFAVIDSQEELLEAGELNLSKKSLWDCATAICEELDRLVCATDPSLVVIESSAGFHHRLKDAGRAGEDLGESRGLCRAALYLLFRLRCHHRRFGQWAWVIDVQPSIARNEVIGRAAGRGTFDKEYVWNWLSLRGFDLPKGPKGRRLMGISDAVLLALWGQKQLKEGKILGSS